MKLLATSCADSCERKKAIHTTMKVLATSYADSCERKKAQYTTLGDSKEKCITSINEIHKRENRGITRKLEKPSTKPMNAQFPYKILLNKIMN